MDDLQDSRHWSNRSEVRRDEFKDAFALALHWALARRRQAAWAAGGAAALSLLAGLAFLGRRARQNAAWDALTQAEIAFYSGRAAEAQTLLSRAAQDGSDTTAALARLLEGDMHYPQGRYDQALAAYSQASQEAPEPLKPYAAADRVAALEAAGKAAECAAAASAFLDAQGDHLLAPQVHAALARCQRAAGQNDAHKTSLQKIALQYPGTIWAEWANALLQPPSPTPKQH